MGVEDGLCRVTRGRDLEGGQCEATRLHGKDAAPLSWVPSRDTMERGASGQPHEERVNKRSTHKKGMTMQYAGMNMTEASGFY